MKIIKCLSKNVKDELEDACKYAKLAIEYKLEYPQVANLFATLSEEEMKHMNMLHSEVTRLIEEYRKANGDPPERMLAFYEYVHEEQIEKAQEVKNYQALYREQ